MFYLGVNYVSRHTLILSKILINSFYKLYFKFVLFDCIKSDDETIDRGFIYDKTNDLYYYSIEEEKENTLYIMKLDLSSKYKYKIVSGKLKT